MIYPLIKPILDWKQILDVLSPEEKNLLYKGGKASLGLFIRTMKAENKFDFLYFAFIVERERLQDFDANNSLQRTTFLSKTLIGGTLEQWYSFISSNKNETVKALSYFFEQELIRG